MAAPTVGLSVEALASATALLVSGLAGAFSLTGLLITKEQKLSEFRQAWVDALRADIAVYLAKVSIVVARIEIVTVLEPEQFLIDNHDDYVDMNQASMRIKLRLNSREIQSQTIMLSMRDIETGMNADLAKIQANAHRIKAASKRLEEAAPLLLKTEWKRVKRGEPIFQFAKWSAGLIFSASAGVAFWIFMRLLK